MNYTLISGFCLLIGERDSLPCILFMLIYINTAVQRQTAVTAYFTSKQLLLFAQKDDFRVTSMASFQADSQRRKCSHAICKLPIVTVIDFAK